MCTDLIKKFFISFAKYFCIDSEVRDPNIFSIFHFVRGCVNSLSFPRSSVCRRTVCIRIQQTRPDLAAGLSFNNCTNQEMASKKIWGSNGGWLFENRFPAESMECKETTSLESYFLSLANFSHDRAREVITIVWTFFGFFVSLFRQICADVKSHIALVCSFHMLLDGQILFSFYFQRTRI